MRKSSLKELRGVVLTTELVLLLIAIIIFATIAFFGIAKTLISQATSDKSTLIPVRAEAWQLERGIAGTIWIQNVGSKTVTVTKVGINVPEAYCPSSTVNVDIKPGEYKPFSVTCSTSQSVSGVYIYVITKDNNEVGMATSVQSASQG